MNIEDEIILLKVMVQDILNQMGTLRNQCGQCRECSIDQESEALNDPSNSLTLALKKFSVMVKDYVMCNNDELKNEIEKIYQEILPFLVKGSPKYKAVHSLKNYIK